MNSISITGQLVADAEIKGEKKSFLEFTVKTLKRGFGPYADKIFKDRIKVVLFGRDIQAQVNELMGGTWVEVIGEASAEGWVDRTDPKKVHARIRVTAKTVNVMQFEEESAAPPQAAEDAGDDAPPPEGGDVPF